MSSQSLSRFRHAARNRLNTISMNAELIKLLSQQDCPPDQIAVCAERIIAECRALGEQLVADADDGTD